MTTRLPEPPALLARVEQLRARQHVCYWAVLSYRDCLELLAGRVPRTLRPQLRSCVKRARAEGVKEYAARVREATA
jgi:hypothetical protein